MKKHFILLLVFIFSCFTFQTALANDAETINALFKTYVSRANTYQPSLIQLYSPSAVIIRQVVKPNGQLVNVRTDMNTYAKQMRIGQSTAKVRHYTNAYSSVNVTQLPNGSFKVTALRQPKGETYKLKTYQIWKKQSNGNWVIVEEMMQTKEQIFLRYAK